jgi:hypothetical protein
MVGCVNHHVSAFSYETQAHVQVTRFFSGSQAMVLMALMAC